MIEIIIPVHNLKKMTSLCLHAIHKNTFTDDYKICYVDNGSDKKDYKQMMQTFRKQFKTKIQFIRNKENAGFIKAVNKAIKITDHEKNHIVIMNNDIIPPKDWDKKFVTLLQNCPEIAVVSGISSRSVQTGWKKTLKYKSTPNLDKMGPEKADMYLSSKLAGKYHYKIALPFHCTMFRPGIFTKIHEFAKTLHLDPPQIGFPLDETFGIGYGEDNNFAILVRRYGMKLACCLDMYILHRHNMTFKKVIGKHKINKQHGRASRILKQRWKEYGGKY